jgi:FkbM family methyltransferase
MRAELSSTRGTSGAIRSAAGASWCDMIVNTGWLFKKLLSTLPIDLVCDIGSMDGTDALACRKAAPNARIYAFEVNPDNLRDMRSNGALSQRRIELVPLAICNEDGRADFHLVDPTRPGVGSRGMSSLHRRPKSPYFTTRTVNVETARLDTFLTARRETGRSLALWLDVEGKAYEVIHGAREVWRDLRLVHVEVELEPCIAPGQALYPQVRALLQSIGLQELAIDRPWHVQFNALFVERALLARFRLPITAWLVLAWLRYRAGLARAWLRRFVHVGSRLNVR